MYINEINILGSYQSDEVVYRFFISIGNDRYVRIDVQDFQLAEFISTFGLSEIKHVLAKEQSDHTITYRIYIDELL